MGFKEYDELIFAKDSNNLAPFTTTQWDTIMKWYKIMSGIAGSLILIVVVIIAYKMIVGGYNIEKRNDAKDSLMRLFFGAVSIIFAPIFVKLLLFLNNNIIHMLLGYANGSLNDVIGNKVLTNIQTGNAIATAIVIAMFAYLFVKLNIKFIIRQFTILIFTLFTPIIAIMWMINKRAIGASIWFGQILINVFMQSIYAFLFLVYMQFLPQSGGWAISLLWAMMILPLADVLQNTLQNLVSRIAGVDNDELASRGIGMAGAMAHSVKAIAYQFKNTNENTSEGNGTNIIERLFSKSNDSELTKIEPMQTSKMETNTMNVTKLNNTQNETETKDKQNNMSIPNNIISDNKIQNVKKAYNVGKEFLNVGMYAADGRNFKTDTTYERPNIHTKRKNPTKQKSQNNIIANMKDDDST